MGALKILMCIFLFVLFLDSFHELLKGFHLPWWQKSILLPACSYATKLLVTAAFINAYVTFRCCENLTIPLLLLRVRKTWPELATAQFYISVCNACISLLVFMMWRVSDASTGTLWFLDAIVKPMILAINLYWAYLEATWTLSLVNIVIMTHYNDGSPDYHRIKWTWAMRLRSTRDIVGQRYRQGVMLSLFSSGCSKLYAKFYSPSPKYLALAVRRIPSCAGTLFALAVYVVFSSECSKARVEEMEELVPPEGDTQ